MSGFPLRPASGAVPRLARVPDEVDAGSSPDVVGESLVAVARALYERGLVVGSVGNVSSRTADGLRITPSRMPYASMEAADTVTVTWEGRSVAGTGHAPSRELPLHLAIYAARQEVGAIVHTHSPHAAAWSFLGEPLEPITEEIEYYGIGPVRTSEPAPAGSEHLASRAVAALGDSRAVLLGRHGVVATGATPADALVVAEAIEHQAQVAWLLRRG